MFLDRNATQLEIRSHLNQNEIRPRASLGNGWLSSWNGERKEDGVDNSKNGRWRLLSIEICHGTAQGFLQMILKQRPKEKNNRFLCSHKL